MRPPSGPGRVLVLSGARGIPLYGPSGASAHLRGVARALAARGDDVHVAVPRLYDHRGRVEDRLGVRVTTVEPRRRAWLPGSWRERGERTDARRLVDRAVADHGVPAWIWERHALWCDAGARLAARHGLPRIVELDAPLALERARFERLRDPRGAARLERETLRSADRVIAVSAWLARWAIEEVGCEPARVRHVPNGTGTTRPGDRDTTRARLGLDGLVIGFVGTFKPWHGVDRLLPLLDALPEATLLAVGDGPVTLPDHPRLVRTGRVAPAELADLVAAMDVSVAPYPLDAPPWFCPLKVLDSLAQGTPVVATDVGDCRSLIGAHGEVLSTDAPLDWAAAVRRQWGHRPRPAPRTWVTVVAEALAG